MEKSQHKIEVRLSNEEYEEMMKQKDFLGYATYAQLIRSYIHTNVSFRIDYSALYDFATELSRIGNNINQITHAVNQTHDITPYQIKLLREHMDKIEDIVIKAVKEKGRVQKRIAEEYWLED